VETFIVKLFLLLINFLAWDVSAVEAFKIHFHDRKMIVESPAKSGEMYAVELQNLSMNDMVGKFHAGGSDLKFVSVKASEAKSIEFKSNKKNVVYFQPLAPAFQEVELIAGKKTYEIPSQP
jgi:hypothetical protein